MSNTEDDFSYDKEEITYSNSINYLYDKLNEKQIVITPAKLGDKVAYSLTYNQETLPSGYMANKQNFIKEYMDTLLVNGYPYRSCEELGVANEDEAYIATQLAVYEALTIKNPLDIKNGDFYIENVVTSDSKYNDALERIKTCVNNLVDLAINHEYSNTYKSSITGQEFLSCKYDSQTNTTLIGPIVTDIKYDEIIKRLNVDENTSQTEFIIENYTPDIANVSVVDKNMNEVNSIDTGSLFYFKVDGEDKYSAGILINILGKILISKLYESDMSNTMYVALDTYNVMQSALYSISNNIDTGKVTVRFKDNDEYIYGAYYQVLNEQKEVIFDVKGYNVSNFTLPVGKYYIKEYKAPRNYLLNFNEYEVDLTVPDTNTEVIIKQDNLF